MRRVFGTVFVACVVALSIGVMSAAAKPASAPSYTQLPTLQFFCTGAQQTYSVPAGVGAARLFGVGASGAPSVETPHGSGGVGALVDAWVKLPKATKTLYVEVGCAGLGDTGGFNGGGSTGSGGGGGGGGATDVRLDPLSAPLGTSDTRLMVAGGGGGGGVCSSPGGAAGQSGLTGAGNGGNAATRALPVPPAETPGSGAPSAAPVGREPPSIPTQAAQDHSGKEARLPPVLTPTISVVVVAAAITAAAPAVTGRTPAAVAELAPASGSLPNSTR